MSNVYKQGPFRGEKLQYKDGIGYCIWYPLVYGDDEEESGLCFDFTNEDIDDLILLLATLKSAPADKYDYTDEDV